MKNERVIVRTITNLSYAGEICDGLKEYGDGLVIKPSEKSEIKIWFPVDEIQTIIKMDGNIIEGEAVKDECRLY